MTRTTSISGAPVLSFWATIVAERMCSDRDIALRVSSSELGGSGHPLMYVRLYEAKDLTFQVSVARPGRGDKFYARFPLHYEDEAGC